MDRFVPAALVALVSVLVLGRGTIPWIRRWGVRPGETASAMLNRLHEHKRHTPTMGGLFVIASIAIALVAFGNLHHATTQAALLLILGFGTLGTIDDLMKCRPARRGLPAIQKLAGQVVIAGAVGIGLGGLELGALVVVVVWIVGASNAVNLTDGLDGLAPGCVAIAAAAIGVIAKSPEVQVLAAAVAGAATGFLRFNRYPARIFLGDSGSLPLGALLALLVTATGRSWVGLIVGAIFAVELASVMLQVGCFKLSGARIFRCAPLHHHFQFAGWPETTTVRRFWMAAGGCALLGWGVATVTPLRGPERTAARQAGSQISVPLCRNNTEADIPRAPLPAGPNFSAFQGVLSPEFPQ